MLRIPVVDGIGPLPSERQCLGVVIESALLSRYLFCYGFELGQFTGTSNRLPCDVTQEGHFVGILVYGQDHELKTQQGNVRGRTETVTNVRILSGLLSETSLTSGLVPF